MRNTRQLHFYSSLNRLACALLLKYSCIPHQIPFGFKYDMFKKGLGDYAVQDSFHTEENSKVLSLPGRTAFILHYA